MRLRQVPKSLKSLAITMALIAGPVFAASDAAPLVLAKFGSFFVGGRVKDIPYRSSSSLEAWDEVPDKITVDQMYVQYLIPAQVEHEVPVVFVHGAWHTGKTWEETPDGREGWAVYFTRAGFDTYWVDKPWRGKSAFDMQPIAAVARGDSDRVPAMTTIGYNGWSTFRFGPAVGELYPGSQFPVEAADQYFAQIVPDFSTELRNSPKAQSYPVLDNDVVALAAKIGAFVFVGHSQGGSEIPGIVRAHPGMLKAAVSVEGGCPPVEDAELYRNTPFLVITGDYIEPKPNCQPFVDALKVIGGSGTNVHLPEIGIHGNDHMMMLDRNSDQIAQLIVDWISREVEGYRQ
jgi:pimeloyl-ACP methyl ester carboxylesterase